MQILFDYQAFEMQPFGGVSKSYAEIISHLKAMGVDARLSIKESNNEHLLQTGIAPSIKSLGTANRQWFGGKKLFRGQRRLLRMGMSLAGYHNDFLPINQDYCIKQLKKQKFDIFEPTFFDSYFLPYLKGKPFVMTVHDMIPEILGVDKPQAQQKKLLCPLAAHIHVPSQNTKKDLVNILNIDPNKVTVTPHGSPTLPTTQHPSPYSFPFLLYVGARCSYKNFAPFIEECAIIIKQHPDLHVVCTGQSFDNEEQKLIASFGLSEQVIHQYATEQEMQALYQNAVAFIYPSAYEGFGMPILEAFICGCPVMLNNASCFPEVGGDGAIYFDINHKGDLAEQIKTFLLSPEQDKTDLVTRGQKRAELFSWEESTRKLLHFYQTIIA
jgi:glycosyltransferase involved in cell wall biosynthesis